MDIRRSLRQALPVSTAGKGVTDEMAKTIYKIVPASLWQNAKDAGIFKGAAIDLTDGYIHFSTAPQAKETVARHFAGQADLLLIAVDADALGEKLVFEPSRGGDLFPHLYADLPLSAVVWEKPLPLGEDGAHQFPEMSL
ncbi:DUF952 domain-containing protein [Shinella sp. G-2]|uniref:DUF952 domain-containing protein n=1 Tax=Shinella sp. G-2 TaxID=3133141 RepID=UPI003CFC6A68